MFNSEIIIFGFDKTLANHIGRILASLKYASQVLDKETGLSVQEIDKSTALFIAVCQTCSSEIQTQLSMVHQKYPTIPMVLLVGDGSIDEAVNVLRDGFSDYLCSPFTANTLQKLVERNLAKSAFVDLPIASDPKSKELLDTARQYATSDASILISGESGVGKEVMANYIHDHSLRQSHKFVAINCAAIPENMLEATLFGYEKGAFTGAHKRHEGSFEQAQNGTILLDEISEMPLALQAKLLRVLQEKECTRLGGNQSTKLDVRVLATTNRDLKEEVDHGRFRNDLYYRLNTLHLHWVPLRQRTMDIIPLAEYLIQKNAKRHAVIEAQLDPSAKTLLQSYTWPGNAREMDNVIQRALILNKKSMLEANDFKLDTQCIKEIAAPSAIKMLKENEKNIILKVLNETQGNRTEAAQYLNISTRTLRYKLAKLRDQGVDVPSSARSSNRSTGQIRRSL